MVFRYAANASPEKGNVVQKGNRGQMNTEIIILMPMLILLGYVGSQVVTLRNKMAGLDRKLNMLLAGMGIDPQKTDFVADSINRISELYRAGKVAEAKQLAKETLINPAEFKKAWQACNSKSAAT